MAQNVIINGVAYQEVPSVDIPKIDSTGTAKFYDTQDSDPSASDIRNGVVVYGKSGPVTGNLAEITDGTNNITTKAQVVQVSAGIHTGGTVQISSAEQAKIVAANIKKGVTILGVAGSLSSATVSQDQVTKVLSIS